MSDAIKNILIETYQKPHGLILSTGPTGSGKTTSMYGIIKQLNTRSVNIMSIEDPVEYDIEGVHQIQVNTKTEVTFASGLRSIVRQDPDIILVGEIRDSETAQIAINSAMTGHLVLSTMHTNDAATTIPRLLDMGVEPFLVASSVLAIIGQRLVRTICPNCKTSVEVERAEVEKLFGKNLAQKFFGDKTQARVYKGKGCHNCHNSGYLGRIGIFELILISEKIRDGIMARKNAEEIVDIAQTEGMLPMLHDGLDKVKQGLTTIEEVLRVTVD